MRAVRQCLSLTLTILCFGVIDTTWFEAAFAEGRTTSSTTAPRLQPMPSTTTVGTVVSGFKSLLIKALSRRCRRSLQISRAFTLFQSPKSSFKAY